METLLVDDGCHPIWHLTGPGRHGVDLVVLTPAGDAVVAIEVKATLRPGHVPRLSRREVEQMSAAWADKADNPGMANWDLRSADVYGAVVAINCGPDGSRGTDRRFRRLPARGLAGRAGRSALTRPIPATFKLERPPDVRGGTPSGRRAR